MKFLGYLAITISFLAGALSAVVDKINVPWPYFIAAIVIGAVGVAMVHLGQKQHDRSEEKLSANLQDIQSSLSRVVQNVKKLCAQKSSLNPYELPQLIDDLFTDDLNSFADARRSLAHAHGLNLYGEIMSYFASGERYLNRVWRASADGYIDEANTYLDKAQTQFTQALQKIPNENKNNANIS